MITIDPVQIEFHEGGNTIWVNGENGNILRIKCSGIIEFGRGCVNTTPHADLMIEGNIHICVPDNFQPQ
jgi:hypothetical protein